MWCCRLGLQAAQVEAAKAARVLPVQAAKAGMRAWLGSPEASLLAWPLRHQQEPLA